MIRIVKASARHWPAIWRIIQPVFQAGDACTYPPDISEPEGRHAWFETPTATYVALDPGDNVVGTYYLKPNQPGLGSHVCNCGYIVAASARGQGIAALLCEHSQREAVRLGFRAMQFNIVVSTNTAAVHLWQKMGFRIIGTVPRAFRHLKLGFVDAFIMFKELAVSATPEVGA